ncbi:MAG: GTPase Era [Clostridiales bacterium]|nr:GTPase Era [Clostridiales bacterium]
MANNMESSTPAHRFGTVALIGRPNAGKSTLLNTLVGEKVAIVTDKPQTTRTSIMGVVTRPGLQMAIFDAPGIHRPKDRLGNHMMNAALGVLEWADVIYYLTDAGSAFGAGEARILQILETIKAPVFLLLNKIDLMDHTVLLPIIDAWKERRGFAQIIPLSALTGENIPSLIAATKDCFPEAPPSYDEDEMTDQPERVIAAEMIREKAILATREEVPYAIAVYIEKMEERRQGLVDIYGVIVVEQPGQKGIIIGKQGATLKRIGTDARVDIEAVLGIKVNLQLWVQVREDWRNKERQLKEYGIGGFA